MISLPQPRFEPIHFIPANRRAEILSRPVLSITTGPHAPDDVPGRTPTNHWCLYLQDTPVTFIPLDCQPSYSFPSVYLPGGSKAFIIVSEPGSLPGENLLLRRFTLDVKPGLTVRDVLDVLCERGRHKYEFTAEGVGCRRWVTDQLELMREIGHLTSGEQVEDVKGRIGKLWTEETPLPLDKGEYYE